MAEAPSPPSMDIDVVVDLHTTNASTAATLLNENSSNASSDNGLNIKFPVLYTSSSDTETEDFHIQRNRFHVGGGGNAASGAMAASSGGVDAVRSSSPPPNCAICLGRCKNKCFTDSCVHQFCFKCLCEWSKVKAECPLCKQAFRSIIHNVKAIDQYEEYLVQQPVVQIPHSPLEVTYQGPLNSGFILNGTRRYYNFSMRSWPTNASGVMGSRSGPLTVRNYMPEDDLSGNSIPSASVAVNAAVESLPMRRSELLNLYRQELPDELSSTMSLGQLWRRYIYDRKLYALPVSDITGRYRESSARFYRNNPGQRIRLMPFANRDIVCLLRNTNHDVSTVLESLNEGLEVSNILSRSFRRRLQPYLGERTAQFIHELSNFARSPYDMIGYDRAVRYAPQAADEDHVIEFSTSSDEEANNNSAPTESTSSSNSHANEATAIQRAVRRNAQASSTTSRTRSTGTSEFRVQSRSTAQPGMHSPMSLLSFTITTTSEGSETPGLSVAVSANSRGHAQVAAINLSTHNRAHNEVVIDLDDTVEINGSNNGDVASDSATNTNPSNSNSANINANNTNNTNNNTNNNTSNDDLALTTPSTSNRVPEGSPQIVASIALSTSSSDECEFVLERKPPHLRTPEMVSLNSESDSDVVFVDESKPIMAEATYSTSENEEQPSVSRLIAEQQDVQDQSTSTGLRPRTVRQLVASKRQSTSSQRRESSSPNKKRRMRTRRINTPPEYSFDGSTSDGDLDGNDGEYETKRRSTIRKRGGLRTRKSTPSRRRNPLKHQRAGNLKNEAQKTEDADQDSTATLTNTSTKKRRRLTRKRDLNPSNNGQICSSSNTKNNSSSEEKSSSEEDDKVNLKALQLRLKKSLSDAEEENTKNDYYNNSTDYTPNMNYDDLSRESNVDTANSINSVIMNNNNNNNNEGNDSNNNNNNNNNNIYPNDNNNSNIVAEVTPPTSPQQPTTSAAAAAAREMQATSAAVASIYVFNDHERSASFEDSNASYGTSCIASTSDVPPEQQQEETRAQYRLNSLSPASLSPASVEPYVPQRLQRPLNMSIESYSPGSLDSTSSIDSFQLPSTSQQKDQQKRGLDSYSASIIHNSKNPTNAHLKDTDSSNSSANSSSSSSTSLSGSEEERDTDDHSLA